MIQLWQMVVYGGTVVLRLAWLILKGLAFTTGFIGVVCAIVFAVLFVVRFSQAFKSRKAARND